MEHAPYVGDLYGSDGNKRIAIMGYSHHGDRAEEHEDTTVDILDGVLDGNHPPTQFFHQIASYFGDEGDAFWRKVAFFNFAPRVIGGSDQKNDSVTGQEYQDGLDRFQRILEQLQPDMLFVFTRKGWTNLLATEEDQRMQSGTLLIAGEEFDRHHYRLQDGKVVQAFRLRHPERAKKEVMRRAVAAALQMQPAPPA